MELSTSYPPSTTTTTEHNLSCAEFFICSPLGRTKFICPPNFYLSSLGEDKFLLVLPRGGHVLPWKKHKLCTMESLVKYVWFFAKLKLYYII